MRFTLSLIALAAFATSVAAAPGVGESTVTVQISFADIDLSKAEGRAVLEARIESKLREACTLDNASRYSYGGAIVDEKCLANARAMALAEVEQAIAANTRRGGELAAN